jgi:hypothetical protein
MRRAIALMSLAGLLAGIAWVGPRPGGRPPTIGATAVSSKSGPSVVVTGWSDMLFPGQMGSLTVRVANRRAFKVEVRSIAVTTANASGGCPATHLWLTSYRGHLKIASHHHKQVALPVYLGGAAPDSCQNALFPLSFETKAQAVR